jgi:integrase
MFYVSGGDRPIPSESHLLSQTVAGTKRERSKGVWELRVYLGRDPLTGKPRQLSRTYRGGAREAGKELSRLVADTADGRHGGSNATVAKLLDDWLEDAERRLSPVTMANYRHVVKTYLRKQLGSIRLDRLGAHDLDRLYRDLERSGQSPYAIRQVHAAMRAALGQGRRWGWVRENVAELARPTPIPQKRLTTPTPAEVLALSEAIDPDDPDLAIIVLLAALTGCRRGELCALRWTDVDWATSVLEVRRSFVVAAGTVHEKAPKSGQARTVTLDPLAIALLKRLRALQLTRAAHTRLASPEDGWLLSIEGHGRKPRRPDAVGAELRRLSRKAGTPLGLHTLRHYAASELVGGGTDVRTVANRLGHADPAFTLRVYSHSVESRDRQAAKMLGRGLGKKKGK